MVFCSISASFLWTAILALHFCLLAVFNNAQLAEKLMPLYHVIAWGLPVLIGLIFLSTETLAFAPFVSGVWCFISAPVKTYKYNDRDVGIKVALKVPEFIGYCIVLVLYVSSITIMCKKFQTQNRKFFSVQMRLACIPVLFILLRVWDTVQYFYYSHVVVLASSNPYGCIPTDVKRTHYAFAVLQAFEGGQGWVNAILYIFLSKDMRKKLIITLACKRKPSSRRHQSVMIPTIGVSTNKPTLPSYTYYSPPVSNEDSSVDMVQVAT